MTKLKLFVLAAALLFGSGLKAAATFQNAARAAFYKTMETGSVAEIDAEIDKLQNSGLKEKEGFEGALLMKKAGLVGKPKDKLKYFKAGRIKLETALLADKDNVELHFLRLTIEEHAPKIVKYKSDIPADKEIVVKGFKQLPTAAQDAVRDYSKTSKVLHPADL